MSTAQPNHRRKDARMEWLLAAQVLLCILVMFGPRRVCGQPAWPFLFGLAGPNLGRALMAAGTILFGTGWLKLGRQLTALPWPRDNATLVQSGPFALVRHPMYSGLLALGFGWAFLLQSWLTVLYAAALFVVLDRKSRREEKWLEERFPAYHGYRQRVRRLVPFIY